MSLRFLDKKLYINPAEGAIRDYPAALSLLLDIVLGFIHNVFCQGTAENRCLQP